MFVNDITLLVCNFIMIKVKIIFLRITSKLTDIIML